MAKADKFGTSEQAGGEGEKETEGRILGLSAFAPGTLSPAMSSAAKVHGPGGGALRSFGEVGSALTPTGAGARLFFRRGTGGDGPSYLSGMPGGASAHGIRSQSEPSLTSRLLDTKVMHARLAPVRHEFTYRNPYFDLDLSELPALNEQLRLFGYNRFTLFSIYDSDHLQLTAEGEPAAAYGTAARLSIDGKLRMLLRRFGHDDSDVARIRLITAPPFLRLGFNPVSFFLCFDGAERLAKVVSEVNNTFGETHLYITDDLREPGARGESAKLHGVRAQSVRFSAKKEFHVSPFNTREGEYRFYVSHGQDEIDIRVDIATQKGTLFVSRLWGRSMPLDDGTLRRMAMIYPRTTTIAATRISLQAAKLYFGKRLPIHTKPIASSAQTIRTAGPGPLQRLSRAVIHRFLSRIERGSLLLSFPDGATVRFGTPQEAGGRSEQSDEQATAAPLPARSGGRGIDSGGEPRIEIENYDFYCKALLGGDVGFGEAYTRGLWKSNDLVGVLRTFVDNQNTLDDRSIAITRLRRAMNRVYHLRRRNTRKRSRDNIFAHYDLGNEFFRLFLDRSMTYSSAYFPAAESSLEEAQLAKLRRVIEKARIRSSDHLLEIGCGWGSFAIEAAKRTGCRVTGVTISAQQLEYARERVRAEGLEDRVSIVLRDYRDIQGSFDRIVSLEMLEAVGHEYLGRYFATVDRLLAPDGVAVLQVITVPDQRYDAYRRGCDWIQRYIFPGGLCPSLTAICSAMTKSSSLFVQDAEDIGVHYARTLREWRYRFFDNLAAVRELGFDEEFIRTWEYYLAYCEAGFAGRLLGTLQLVLSRPNNSNLRGAPGY